MPKVKYKESKVTQSTLDTIARANEIIEDYQSQGLTLTLRQLYYQFVRRNWVTNTERSYDLVGNAVNTGRLIGMIDWRAIEDRTRNLSKNSHWDSPADIIEGAARSYQIDKWQGQDYQPEVWIEKEALAGVIETPCQSLDVPFFACRGYTSQSEMWAASQRLLLYRKRDLREPVIIHLGDHDPSGIDMSRDIEDRLETFMGSAPKFVRIALNMSQIQQYNPPPNPAKTTDSRFVDYRSKFGDDSWELDALDPSTLVALVRDEVEKWRDEDTWDEQVEKEGFERQSLLDASNNWPKIEKLLKRKKK